MDPSKSNGSGGGEFPTAKGWKKFEAPPTFLQTEEKLETMVPTEQITFDYVLKKLNILSRNTTSQAERDQYDYLIAQLKADRLAGQCTEDFIQDFFLFIQGRSKYNVVEKKFKFNPNGNRTEKFSGKVTCPWGPKPYTHLFDVKDFVDSLVDQRASVIKYISNLKLRWPRNITELWIWYKYIAREQGVDGFLINYARFLEPYDFIPPEKVPLNPADGSSTYVYEGTDYSPEVQAFRINNPNPPVYNDERTNLFIQQINDLITNRFTVATMMGAQDAAGNYVVANNAGGDLGNISADWRKDYIKKGIALLENSYDIPPEVLSSALDQIEQNLLEYREAQAAIGNLTPEADALFEYLEFGQFKPQSEQEMFINLIRRQFIPSAAGGAVGGLNAALATMQNSINVSMNGISVALNNFNNRANQMTTDITTAIGNMQNAIVQELQGTVPNVTIGQNVEDIKNLLRNPGGGGGPGPGGAPPGGGGGAPGAIPPGGGGAPPPGGGGGGGPGAPPPGGGGPGGGGGGGGPPAPQIQAIADNIATLNATIDTLKQDINKNAVKHDVTNDAVSNAITDLKTQLVSMETLYKNLQITMDALSNGMNDNMKQVLADHAKYYSEVTKGYQDITKQLTGIVKSSNKSITQPTTPPTSPRNNNNNQPPPPPVPAMNLSGSPRSPSNLPQKYLQSQNELAQLKLDYKKLENIINILEQQLRDQSRSPQPLPSPSPNIIISAPAAKPPNVLTTILDDDDEELLQERAKVIELQKQIQELQSNFAVEKKNLEDQLTSAATAHQTNIDAIARLKTAGIELMEKHKNEIAKLKQDFAAEKLRDMKVLQDQLDEMKRQSDETKKDYEERIKILSEKLSGPFAIKLDEQAFKPLSIVDAEELEALDAIADASISGMVQPNDVQKIKNFIGKTSKTVLDLQEIFMNELLGLIPEISGISSGQAKPHVKRMFTRGMNPSDPIVIMMARANLLHTVANRHQDVLKKGGVMTDPDLINFNRRANRTKTFRSLIFGMPVQDFDRNSALYDFENVKLKNPSDAAKRNVIRMHFDAYYKSQQPTFQNAANTFNPMEAAKIITLQKIHNQASIKDFDKMDPYVQSLLSARDYVMTFPAYGPNMMEELIPMSSRLRTNLVSFENGVLKFSPINGAFENVVDWTEQTLTNSINDMSSVEEMSLNISSQVNRIQVDEMVNISNSIQQQVLQGGDIVSQEKLAELDRELKRNLNSITPLRIIPNISSNIIGAANVLSNIAKTPYFQQLMQSISNHGVDVSDINKKYGNVIQQFDELASVNNVNPATALLSSLRDLKIANDIAKQLNTQPEVVAQFAKDVVYLRGALASKDELEKDIKEFLNFRHAALKAENLIIEIGFLLDKLGPGDNSYAAIMDTIDTVLKNQTEKEVSLQYAGAMKSLKETKNMVDSTIEVAKRNYLSGHYEKSQYIQNISSEEARRVEAYNQLQGASRYIASLSEISNALDDSIKKYSNVAIYSVSNSRGLINEIMEVKHSSDLALSSSLNYIQKNVIENNNSDLELLSTPLGGRPPNIKKVEEKKIRKKMEAVNLQTPSQLAQKLLDSSRQILQIGMDAKERREKAANPNLRVEDRNWKMFKYI